MRIGALVAVGLCLVVISPVSSEWGEPVNLGPNVNSNGFEYYPSISADETTLYFADPNRPGGFGSDDIWISTWDGLEWGLPLNAGPNVNSVGRELSPSISSDGTKLYFVSYGRPGGYGSYDVWVSTWEDTMWGPPANAGPNVNTLYIEFTVCISFDGKKLYFSSNRPGSLGDDDLWVSEWDSSGAEWGPPQNLGPNVNTFIREYCPSVSSDGTKLYFARWMGISHPDIFVSEWQDTTWGIALNLGAPINTPTWDNGPSISSDGLRLYFASSRDTNDPAVQDIWVSEWMPGVEERGEGAREWLDRELLLVEPNPVLSRATVQFKLPVSCSFTLKMHDASGRTVKTLSSGRKSSGTHEVLWDGTASSGQRVGAGVYFCCMRVGNVRRTCKVVVLD